MRFSKAVALPLLLVIALGITGLAYAWWTETLQIDGTVNTGELKVIFWNDPTEPTWGPTWRVPNWRGYGTAPYVTRTWSLSSDQKTLTITLGNMYPRTGSQRIAFGMRNVGTIPAKLENVTIAIDGSPDLAYYVRTQGKIEYFTSTGTKLWEKSFGNWPHIDGDLHERDVRLELLGDTLTSLLAGTVLNPGDFLAFGEETEEGGCLGFALHATAPDNVELQSITFSLSFEFVQWNAP